jgi:excisionase family DNA binding protein
MNAPSTTNSDSNLVRFKGAAARLGVSVRTLYRIVAEGGLPLVHIRGCSCLKEADLTAYVEKSRTKEKP